MPAFACKVTEDNLSAITSEGGKKLTREAVRSWLDEHQEGYFLRDEESVFDCALLHLDVFSEMYFFESGDTATLFRRVVKKS